MEISNQKRITTGPKPLQINKGWRLCATAQLGLIEKQPEAARKWGIGTAEPKRSCLARLPLAIRGKWEISPFLS